jgi:NADH:ubiquinone oxidoreductase subunit 5 (subunit L)/multisubunit Na+/H+ antiporter MnhA subunit
MKKIFDFSSTILYLFASLTLILIALLILWWSLHEIYLAFYNASLHKEFILTMLQSIGTVIITVAILDISKFLIEEEVFRSKELREAKEARRTLTKIMTIIAIAVSIEGLVYIFKAGTEDLRLLIYPSLLIFTSVLVTVGLGVYQKLTSKIEE